MGLLDAVLTAAGKTLEVPPAYRKALALMAQIADSQTTHAGLVRLRTLGFSPGAILDVGAYEGEWMRMAKAVFPQARILMVEAQPDKAPQLERACSPFAGSVEYRIALLGRENRAAMPFYQMDTPLGSTGSSIYEEQTTFDREVIGLPMHRLDDLLAAHADRSYALVKLDVQGAEIDILRCALQVLQGAEAFLLEAGILQFNKGAPLLDDVIAFMKSRGFVVFDILEHFRIRSGVLLQCDVLFVRASSRLRPSGPGAFQ